MKNRALSFIIIALFAFTLSGMAQTKPKAQTKPATKKTATKKAPAKAINVYVCMDGKDKFYHKYSSCKNLNKCSNEIKNVKSAVELKKYKKKSCPHCFNL
jgi:hypothetical protein